MSDEQEVGPKAMDGDIIRELNDCGFDDAIALINSLTLRLEAAAALRSLDAPRGREEIAALVNDIRPMTDDWANNWSGERTRHEVVMLVQNRLKKFIAAVDVILAFAPAPAEGVREALQGVVDWWDSLPPNLRQDIEGSGAEPGVIAIARRAAQDTADRTGAQISELDEASNACLELAAEHGFATGHGDTVADMIREFSAQIKTPARTTAARTDGREAVQTANDDDWSWLLLRLDRSLRGRYWKCALEELRAALSLPDGEKG